MQVSIKKLSIIEILVAEIESKRIGQLLENSRNIIEDFIEDFIEKKFIKSTYV